MLPLTPFEYWRTGVTMWSRAAQMQLSMVRMTLDTVEGMTRPFPVARHAVTPARMAVEAVARATSGLVPDVPEAAGPSAGGAQTKAPGAPQSKAYAREATRSAQKVSRSTAFGSSSAAPRPKPSNKSAAPVAPEPAAAPKPAAKSDTASKPAAKAQAAQKSTSKAAAKPAAKTASRPAAKASAKPAAKTAEKPVAIQPAAPRKTKPSSRQAPARNSTAAPKPAPKSKATEQASDAGKAPSPSPLPKTPL